MSSPDAVKSYDEALALLESLPLEENALYPRRLAITWINRGIALQKRDNTNDPWEAAECFREAIALLERLPVAPMNDGPLLAGRGVDQPGRGADRPGRNGGRRRPAGRAKRLSNWCDMPSQRISFRPKSD